MIKAILLCSLISIVSIVLSALEYPAGQYGTTMGCQYCDAGKYATIDHTSCVMNKVDFGVGVMATDNPNNAMFV